MAIKIGGTDVIDNDRKGTFLKLNPGVYTTSARDSLSASAGDVIYNDDDEELQVWTGTEWKSAGSAPQPTINNVILSEDVNDSIRFQSKGFTANVIMDPESNPVSQKGVKALLSGNFPVYKESGAISNVSTTSSVSLNYNDRTGATYVLADGDIFGDFVDERRFILTLSCPTTRGGGNGPGYWVWNQNWLSMGFDDEPGYYQFYGSFSKSYTQDLTGLSKVVVDLTENSVAFQGTSLDSSSGVFNTDALRMQILNDIVWLEYSSASDSSGFFHAWEDSTGNHIFYAENTRNYNGVDFWGEKYCQTSDGEQVYWARFERTSFNDNSSGINRIVIGSKKKGNTPSFQWSTGIRVLTTANDLDINTGSIADRPSHMNIVYHKPSNRLVLYYIKNNDPFKSYCRSYSIDNSIEGNGRLTFLTQVSQSITDLVQMTYCGDDGSYITTQFSNNPEVMYKYDSVQSKFVPITTPTYITPEDRYQEIHISGIGDGTIYASGYTSGTEGYRYYVWRSSNEGTTWVRNSAIDSNTPGFTNMRALGMGSSNELIQTFYNFSIGTAGINDFPYVNILTDRTQTVTVPLATNFANGEVVAKKGDQYNPAFIGIVTNKSGSNFDITSRQAYSNGDELINLSDFTQSSTTKYLKLSSGNTYTALGIEEEDFGFTSVGTTTGIGITFPANLSSGNLTDQQIPAGTGLSVIVQASNGTEISTFTSNTVFPS